MNFRFPVHEKLKDAQSINFVFENGRKFHYFPLLFLTSSLPEAGFTQLAFEKSKYSRPPFKIAFTVPKKRIRSAVDRNRIKRLMREAWRLQKNRVVSDLDEMHKPTVGIIAIFIGKEIPEYSTIFKAMNRYIDQLAEGT